MNTSFDSNGGSARPDETVPGHDLPPRVRSAGVIAWCSFLAAGAATTVVFAFFDPATVPSGDVPAWWQSRHAVYAIGFFFFWSVAAFSAALTLYMIRTERTGTRGRE